MAEFITDINIQNILNYAISMDASDVYIVAGCPITMKVSGEMLKITEQSVMPDVTKQLVNEIYSIYKNENMIKLNETGDADFSFSISHLGRFRCNAYKQRGSYAAVLRVVKFDLPDFSELNIPKKVIELASLKKGLVLVTGPTGSGKSTTLASIIDTINHTQKKHIITIEDPIEFIHKHDQSIVSQREIDEDTGSYQIALRAALRQSPDVILLGEMRDFETIQTAITAAETGQLVFSTLHTVGAAKTIDRIIDVFPPAQQQQVRIQLSMVLQAVVSQQLIPGVNGEIVPAFEIMVVNSAIRNLIRESKVFQIDNFIYQGQSEGMQTMDSEILRLYNEKKISAENALLYATNKDAMAGKIR